MHSPFVFQLHQTCIKKQRFEPNFEKIEALRKELKKSKQEISYEDFGASQKSRNTTVGVLANQHLKPARIAQVLYFIAKNYPYQNFIELGTSLGITTSYLAFGSNQTAQIHTIEACQDVQNKAKETFQKLGIDNKINSQLGTFDEILPSLLVQTEKLDFLFIDGNHSYEATLRYFELCKPFLHNDSVIVFDDIYWSKGMTQAWEEIKSDAMVKVSVDLFFVGLVYFRKEQVKEHFKLRIL